MTPCNGSANIDIKSASPGSWRYLPSFNSSDDFNAVSVTIPAKFAEQAVFVTASVNTVFDVVVYTTLYDRPTPGNEGRLSAEMIVSGTAQVLFNTTDEVRQRRPAGLCQSNTCKPSELDGVKFHAIRRECELYLSNISSRHEAAPQKGHGRLPLGSALRFVY